MTSSVPNNALLLDLKDFFRKQKSLGKLLDKPRPTNRRKLIPYHKEMSRINELEPFVDSKPPAKKKKSNKKG